MKIKFNLPMVIGFTIAFICFRAIDIGGIWTYLAVGSLSGTLCFITGAIWQISNDQVLRFNRNQKNKRVDESH